MGSAVFLCAFWHRRYSSQGSVVLVTLPVKTKYSGVNYLAAGLVYKLYTDGSRLTLAFNQVNLVYAGLSFPQKATRLSVGLRPPDREPLKGRLDDKIKS